MAALLFGIVHRPGGDFEIGEEEVSLQGAAAHHRPLKYRTFTRGYKTLGQLFAQGQTAASTERVCIVLGDERWTYGKVFRHAGALAHHLASNLHVRAGDRVAIAMRNLPEWVVAFVAATSIGAIATPLNSWWGARELGHCIQDCEPAAIIADAPRWHALQQCLLVGVRGVVLVRPGAHPHAAGGALEAALYGVIVEEPGNQRDLPDLTSIDKVGNHLPLKNHVVVHTPSL
jgi:long-chain acyl-CoA synthetase